MYQQFTMLGSCLIQNISLHTAAIVFTLTFSSLSHLLLWCSRASSNSSSLEESDMFLAPENSCHSQGFCIEPSLLKVEMHPRPSNSFTPLWPQAAPQHAASYLGFRCPASEVAVQATGNDSPVAQEAVLAQSYHCCTSLVFSMPHRVVRL